MRAWHQRSADTVSPRSLLFTASANRKQLTSRGNGLEHKQVERRADGARPALSPYLLRLGIYLPSYPHRCGRQPCHLRSLPLDPSPSAFYFQSILLPACFLHNVPNSIALHVVPIAPRFWPSVRRQELAAQQIICTSSLNIVMSC